MSLKLLHTDLTQFPCDAAVFAADASFSYGGSVFGACVSAGATVMRDALLHTDGCAVGQAVCICSEMQGMPCRNLILTAAPTWKDGMQGETDLLAQCYRSSIEQAVQCGCRKIGIALIDSRVYGFPKETALETAVQAILEHPMQPELDIYLIAFDWSSYGSHADRMAELERYISRTLQSEIMFSNSITGQAKDFRFFHKKEKKQRGFAAGAAFAACESAASLDERLKQMDEGFTQMLLRKIDEAGMKDSECYKKANVSRQLFSKIRSDAHYRPKKETVIAFALALQLDLTETNALLRTAGYSLSHSSKFDIIIEYFIMQHNFNVFEINEALYQYDQPVLGTE